MAFNGGLPSLRKFRLKLGQGIAGSVAARGEAIIVNDMEKSLQFFPVIDEESGFRTRSALCVPMISQGRVIGVIEVLNKVNGPLRRQRPRSAAGLAASVCIALENARLYKETVAAAAHERDVRRMFQKFVPKEVVDKIVHGPGIGDRPVDRGGQAGHAAQHRHPGVLANLPPDGSAANRRAVEPILRRHGRGRVPVSRDRGQVSGRRVPGRVRRAGLGADDADNAVMAALEMRRMPGRWNRRIPSGELASIHMGISVHTGEVVVGQHRL